MGGSGSELSGLGNSVAVSLVSLSLLCLVAWLVLRWLRRQGVGSAPAGMRVLGRCQLEPRRSLYVIEIAGRCFVVGVGEGAPSLITELDRAALGEPPIVGEHAGSPFTTLWSKLLRRRTP